MATAEIQLSEEQAQQQRQALQANAMKHRKQEIVDAVSTMIDEHDRWADDPDAPEVPTQRLELAIDAAILECAHGDIPSDCRQLVTSMDVFAGEWSLYKSGKWDHQQRPMPQFWDAFRDVMAARRGATVTVKRSIEPVAELIRQKVPHAQIATIYGGERGPFLDGGVLQVELILREAEEKGSVIPTDWVHPDAMESEQRQMENLKGKLAALQSRDSRSVKGRDKPEEATIEQMIREGANVEQISSVKGVSADEVRDVAEQCGLQALEREILTGDVKSPYDPRNDREDNNDDEGPPAANAGTQPQAQPMESEPKAAGEVDEIDWGAGDTTAVSGADANPTVSADGTTESELNRIIVEEHANNPDMGADQLAALLSESLDIQVTPPKVAAVLREQKQAAGV